MAMAYMKFSFPELSVPETEKRDLYYGLVYVVVAVDLDARDLSLMRHIRFTKEAAIELAKEQCGTFYERVLVLPPTQWLT